MKGKSYNILEALGFASVSYGVALWYMPVGWITAGVFLILWSNTNAIQREQAKK